MRRFILAAIVALTASSMAQAQLALPGSVQSRPAAKPGQALDPNGNPVKRARSVAVKPPAEEAVIGRELTLNGSRGRIELQKNGGDLDITKLTLDGTQISRPDDACRVEVVSGTPLAAKVIGHPAGAMRYGLALEACPFTFDVLNGAILVGTEPAFCEFKAADCKVTAVGLWGPRGSSFGPDKSKEIEKARNSTEASMRENFRDLLARSQGKAAIKTVASQQAGFSSLRSEICRDYAREDVHGFCALRITEARAMLLRAEIGANGKEAAQKKPARRKRKAKPEQL